MFPTAGRLWRLSLASSSSIRVHAPAKSKKFTPTKSPSASQCSCIPRSLQCVFITGAPSGERFWRVEEVLQERPCFCGSIGHPLPVGVPKVVGGRLAGTCHPVHVGTAGLLPVYLSVRRDFRPGLSSASGASGVTKALATAFESESERAREREREFVPLWGTILLRPVAISRQTSKKTLSIISLSPAVRNRAHSHRLGHSALVCCDANALRPQPSLHTLSPTCCSLHIPPRYCAASSRGLETGTPVVRLCVPYPSPLFSPT